MAMRPLRDRVLVERIEEQEQRIGGIIVPDSAKEKPQQGRVVAVGKGRVNDKGEVFPLDVKVGDTVLFGKYGGTEVKVDGKEYLILREDEILGVTEGVPELAGVHKSQIPNPKSQIPKEQRLKTTDERQKKLWQSRSSTARARVMPCCAASTSW